MLHRIKNTRTVQVLLRAVSDFTNDQALTQAAALAFYTVLSLSPLLIILLWMSQQLGFENQKILLNQVVELIGPEAGSAIQTVITSAKERPDLGTFAGWAGFVLLLVSAGGIFQQIQSSLNRVWSLQVQVSIGWWGWLKKRVLSAGMVFSIGFIAIVSLVASAVISFILAYLPQTDFFLRYVAQTANFILSIGVFSLFFSAMFKYLPDSKITWRDVWFGGFLTALLFTIGKWLIGIYLGRSSVGSAFGAAGSLVVLLVWVYYSSVIFLFGAELTQAMVAHAKGLPRKKDVFKKNISAAEN